MVFTNILATACISAVVLASCSQPEAPGVPESKVASSGSKSSGDATSGTRTSSDNNPAASAPAPEASRAPAATKTTETAAPPAATATADKKPTTQELTLACEQKGFYFDLAKTTCTTRPLAKFKCDLAELLLPTSEILAANQKEQIGGFFKNQLAGYTLRACVDDGTQFTLIAVKEDTVANKVFIQTLDVPK